MATYWDRGTERFMTTEQVMAHGATAREATHAEIKALLEVAVKGWRDLLEAVGRSIGEAP